MSAHEDAFCEFFDRLWQENPTLGPHDLADKCLQALPPGMVRQALRVTIRQWVLAKYTSRRVLPSPATTREPALFTVPQQGKARIRDAIRRDASVLLDQQWPDRHGAWKALRDFTAEDCAHLAEKSDVKARQHHVQASKWRRLRDEVARCGGTVGDLPAGVTETIWNSEEAA